MTEVIIKYRDYVIRMLPDGSLIAIPESAKCFYSPKQKGISKDKSIELMKEIVKDVIYQDKELLR